LLRRLRDLLRRLRWLEKSGGNYHRAHALTAQHFPLAVNLKSRAIAISS
jgi:hypothetical protein